ncbi:hypothetical protein [Sphingobacterium puteale]|uniref:hypothetical protein n=1 Tax=Sphingobacterium puteale TaxID=2420510 RepID=UPI003D9871C4
MEQTTDKSYIDQLAGYFQQNPNSYGWILFFVGIILLYGSIRRWSWLFEGGEGLFNIAWIEETFGCRTALILFILLSLVFIGAGITWVFLYK